MDVCMPNGGVDATAEMLHACPAVRVLALSRHAGQASLRRMLAAGASGYGVKRAALGMPRLGKARASPDCREEGPQLAMRPFKPSCPEGACRR